MKLIEKLEWDSDFFGISIGRYLGNAFDDDLQRKFRADFNDGGYDCVYAFLRPDDAETAVIAAEEGFFLADVRAIYALSREGWEKAEFSSDCRIIKATDGESLSQLKKIARRASWASRFSFDPRFKGLVAEMYEIWVERIIRDANGAVIAFVNGGTIAGFAAALVNGDVGELVLVATAAGCEGRGIGKEVARGGIHWLKERGVKKILVKTQERNIAAGRLYQSVGFRSEKSELIYHISE